VVVNLVVITYLVSQIMSGSFDPESPSESDMGLLLTLDHLMFIGVMTNTLFGVVTASLRGAVHTKVDTVVWWGVNVGLVGFGVGLATTTQVLKRLSTPVMGAALLYGIWALLRELRLSPREAPAAVS
jgi:predicted membrane protein